MPNADVARVQRRIAKFTDELAGKPMADRLAKLGKEMQGPAEQAVRETPSKAAGRTLSDLSMSGWPRKNPAKLGTRVSSRAGGGRSSVLVTPNRTAGMWRVLEDGRKGYGRGDRREYERRTKSGEVRVSRRKVKRSLGATEGKATWSRATVKMARVANRNFPRRVSEAFRKTFGVGGG